MIVYAMLVNATLYVVTLDEVAIKAHPFSFIAITTICFFSPFPTVGDCWRWLEWCGVGGCVKKNTKLFAHYKIVCYYRMWWGGC